MAKRSKASKKPVFSARCKVCNTMVDFDLSKPLPKVWRCPNCGSKNYTKPKPAESA